MLRAWTSLPHEGTSYFLSFDGEYLLHETVANCTASCIAQLTTNQAKSGTIVLSSSAGKSICANIICKIFQLNSLL